MRHKLTLEAIGVVCIAIGGALLLYRATEIADRRVADLSEDVLATYDTIIAMESALNRLDRIVAEVGLKASSETLPKLEPLRQQIVADLRELGSSSQEYRSNSEAVTDELEIWLGVEGLIQELGVKTTILLDAVEHQASDLTIRQHHMSFMMSVHALHDRIVEIQRNEQGESKLYRQEAQDAVHFILKAFILVFSLVLIVVTGGGAYRIVVLSRRVSALKQETSQIGRESLCTRISIASGDEFEEIADHINAMVDRLAEVTVSELSPQFQIKN